MLTSRLYTHANSSLGVCCVHSKIIDARAERVETVRSRRAYFGVQKRPKSVGVRSGEYEGWKVTSKLLSVSIYWTSFTQWAVALSWWRRIAIAFWQTVFLAMLEEISFSKHRFMRHCNAFLNSISYDNTIALSHFPNTTSCYSKFLCMWWDGVLPCCLVSESKKKEEFMFHQRWQLIK